MTQRFVFRKGFLKLQRLGPVKFADQGRWKVRAPESTGMWAFPYPHFDLFYAYHRYTDLMPKALQERGYPKDSSWYRKGFEDDAEPVDAISFRHDPDAFSPDQLAPFWQDENGEWQEAYVSPSYYQAQDAWVENVGKKILPVREFWYSGDLYTHFRQDGSVGNWTMGSGDEGNEWSLMSAEKLGRLMARGGVKDFQGSYDGEGKPQAWNFSNDHLEVFIPRGHGIIRDRL